MTVGAVEQPVQLGSDEFQLLRELVERTSGIALGDEKDYLVANRLAGLLERHGCASYRALWEKAQGPAGGPLRDEIVDAMTTNETLWFRDDGPWAILRRTLLPVWIEALRGGVRTVRIWSCGCSTGQEPYSIAMTILEHLAEHARDIEPHRFSIAASDVSNAALVSATLGRYDGFAVRRGLDAARLERFFAPKGALWEVSREVKDLVAFRRLNLKDDFGPLGNFDAVFCRNVLIYFSNALRRDICSRIAATMRRDAVLVVGASESLQGAFAQFRLQQLDSHFYYRLKSGGAA